MKPCDPILLLDTVLGFLADRELWNEGHTATMIERRLSKLDIQVLPFSVQEVLDKLVEDKYATANQDRYRVSLHGYQFRQSDGYHCALGAGERRIRREAAADHFVIIAGIAAVCLLVVEICKLVARQKDPDIETIVYSLFHLS